MLFRGDCLEHLKTLEANSIDSLVTDPPAGISFMGKEWDKGEGFIESMQGIFQECLRVLKPGAHGLVWALPRTSHWTATALELAGFEIRDVITHVFGSGFPKSLDISKAIDKAAGADREVVGRYQSPEGTSGESQGGMFGDAGLYNLTAPATPEAKEWQGWGTALKPASEHWILVRKSLSEKTVAANVLRWNTGGLNIDATRIKNDSKSNSVSAETSREEHFGNSVFKLQETNASLEKHSEEAEDKKLQSRMSLGIKDACQESTLEEWLENGQRIQNDQSKWSSNSGASSCDGNASGKITASDGSCPPHQPESERQQDRKSCALHGTGETHLRESRDSLPYDRQIPASLGRFPSNFVLSHNEDCDETCTEGCAVKMLGESSRFFLCAKADRIESCDANTVKKHLSLQRKLEDSVQNLVAIAEALEDSQLKNTTILFTKDIQNKLKSDGACNMQPIQNIVEKFLQELKLIESLSNNPVSLAEIQKPIDITMTILNLLTFDGYAENVTLSSMQKSLEHGEKVLRSKLIYCAKASKKDRNAGLEGMPEKSCDAKQQNSLARMENGVVTNERPAEPKNQNFHPTVKSTKLMQYLIKLVTPPGGRVLDPFMGSGSTCVAAIAGGFLFTGIEKDEEYFAIAEQRVEHEVHKTRAHS